MDDNIFISTQCIKRGGIIESIEAISEITPNIELTGGNLYEENLLDKLRQIKGKKQLNLLIHGYFPPPKNDFVLNFACTGNKTRDFIRETMAFVRALDIEYYSVHGGFKRDFDVKDEILINPSGPQYTMQRVYENIEWFKREFPEKILVIENLYPNNNDPENSLLTHIDEITELMDSGNHVYLLLDLGHLKISSRLFRFNYLDAVNTLFERFGNRIREVHLSENTGNNDDHFIVHTDSVQYMIIRKYARIIAENKINIAVESRNSSIDELTRCYNVIKDALTPRENDFII
ncbi:MAG: DUF692 family protein [Nitrospirae bacterium]|nr:DUF692 family protein [Nitrospirota bacterium]